MHTKFWSKTLKTPEKERPLGRPRRRWKDSIKIDLPEIVLEGDVWIHVA
jgi:hypothetical protein